MVRKDILIKAVGETLLKVFLVLGALGLAVAVWALLVALVEYSLPLLISLIVLAVIVISSLNRYCDILDEEIKEDRLAAEAESFRSWTDAVKAVYWEHGIDWNKDLKENDFSEFYKLGYTPSEVFGYENPR